MSRFRVEVSCDKLAVALLPTRLFMAVGLVLLARAETTWVCWVVVSLVLRASSNWSWTSPPLGLAVVAARMGVEIRLATVLASTVPLRAVTTAVWAVCTALVVMVLAALLALKAAK